jgi:hypothetical protein
MMAIEEIMSGDHNIKKDAIEWLSLDLTNVPSVLNAAQAIKAKERRLDILGKWMRVRV